METPGKCNAQTVLLRLWSLCPHIPSATAAATALGAEQDFSSSLRQPRQPILPNLHPTSEQFSALHQKPNRRKNKPLSSSDRGSLRRPFGVSCLDHTSLQCGLALQRFPPHRAAFQAPALPLKAKYTRAVPADGLCMGSAPVPSAVRGDTGCAGSPGTPKDVQCHHGQSPRCSSAGSPEPAPGTNGGFQPPGLLVSLLWPVPRSQNTRYQCCRCRGRSQGLQSSPLDVVFFKQDLGRPAGEALPAASAWDAAAPCSG